MNSGEAMMMSVERGRGILHRIDSPGTARPRNIRMSISETSPEGFQSPEEALGMEMDAPETLWEIRQPTFPETDLRTPEIDGGFDDSVRGFHPLLFLFLSFVRLWTDDGGMEIRNVRNTEREMRD